MSSQFNSQEFGRARDLDCQSSLSQLQVLQSIKQPVGLTKVPTCENDSFLFQFLARTNRRDLPTLDISFERNFLDQHIKTLEVILQNSEESLLTSAKQQPFASIQTHVSNTLSLPSKTTLLSFLQTHELTTKLTEADQLLKDLQKESDLSQFISHFINSFCKEIAIGLITIAADLWCSARQQHLRHLEIHQLQRITHQWAELNAEKYFNRLDLQPLITVFSSSKIPHSQNSPYQLFENRLIIFSTTLLLIAAGFFENPYLDGQLPPQVLSEVDYPKRQSPCLRSEFSYCSQFVLDSDRNGEPQKRVKRQ